MKSPSSQRNGYAATFIGCCCLMVSIAWVSFTVLYQSTIVPISTVSVVEAAVNSAQPLQGTRVEMIAAGHCRFRDLYYLDGSFTVAVPDHEWRIKSSKPINRIQFESQSCMKLHWWEAKEEMLRFVKLSELHRRVASENMEVYHVTPQNSIALLYWDDSEWSQRYYHTSEYLWSYWLSLEYNELERVQAWVMPYIHTLDKDGVTPESSLNSVIAHAWLPSSTHFVLGNQFQSIAGTAHAAFSGVKQINRTYQWAAKGGVGIRYASAEQIHSTRLLHIPDALAVSRGAGYTDMVQSSILNAGLILKHDFSYRFHQHRLHTLQRLGIDLDTAPHDKPVITYIDRQATGNRRLDDMTHQRFIRALQQRFGERAVVQHVVWEDYSAVHQVELAYRTNIFIGVHGNGLTHIQWAQPGSIVLEINPDNFWLGDYALLARLCGHRHLSITSAGWQMYPADWRYDQTPSFSTTITFNTKRVLDYIDTELNKAITDQKNGQLLFGYLPSPLHSGETLTYGTRIMSADGEAYLQLTFHAIELRHRHNDTVIWIDPYRQNNHGYDGNFRPQLLLQGDCNLVASHGLADEREVLWAADSYNHEGCQLHVTQTQLYIQNAAGAMVWQSDAAKQ